MTRTPVKSSQISSVGYDPEKQKLEVEFKNGSVYEYDNVPQSTYNAFIGSPSVGEYFNRNLKWGFVYRKL